MRHVFGLLACSFLAAQQVSAWAQPGRARRDAPFEQVRDRPEWSHQNADEDQPEKYFHESTFAEHYDGRFADRPLNYNERRSHLTALIQTCLSSMNDMGAETWIMHGTLLGWYWNRKILPWDSDIDVMISEQSIYHLASFYNMTMHHFPLGEGTAARNYLLEVNPHYTNDSLDGVNKIDARWIDTDTGLFIDVTTLRRNKTAEAMGIGGAMMVKDNHHYSYDDIFPLRHSTFEGYPMKIPYAYADLLIEEYGEKALSDVYFQNHRFDSEKQEWVVLRYAELVRYQEKGVLLDAWYWGRGMESYSPD